MFLYDRLKLVISYFPFLIEPSRAETIKIRLGSYSLLIMNKLTVKKNRIGKYINKIDFNCCEHRNGRNKYLLGYSGVRCCKVAICLDCDGIQFVGSRFWKILYLISRIITKNRIDIIEIIESMQFYHNTSAIGEK